MAQYLNTTVPGEAVTQPLPLQEVPAPTDAEIAAGIAATESREGDEDEDEDEEDEEDEDEDKDKE